MLKLTDKYAIQRSIEKKFPPGNYTVAEVASYLIQENQSHREYGYSKCKDFLADFPELFHVYYKEETRADWVTIKNWVPKVIKSNPVEARDITTTMKGPSPKMQTRKIPTQPFYDFCQLPDGIVSFISRRFGGKSETDILDELTKDYALAQEQKTVRTTANGRIIFPCHYRKADKTPIDIVLQRNQQAGKPWILSYIDVGEQDKSFSEVSAKDNQEGSVPNTAVPEQVSIEILGKGHDSQTAHEDEGSSAQNSRYNEEIEKRDLLEPPAESLDQFCLLPDKPIGFLCDLSGETAAMVRSAITEDYQIAISAKTAQISTMSGVQRISFPIRYKKSDGSDVVLTIQTGAKHTELSWYLKYVDYVVSPGKEIESFAYVGWPNFLSKLAEKALPEAWDFEKSPWKDFDILKKYITYTFYRLKLENKILVSGDGEFAAFNTGLVDEHYNDICACFERNKAVDKNVPWIFKEFATPGYREYGKKLTTYFNPLPERAKYFQRKEDLLYDLDRELLCDYDHIIIDNVHRLPVSFLCNQLYDYTEAAESLKVLREDPTRREMAYKKLRNLLNNGSKWCNRLTNRMKEAIDLAKKQISWNFKTAIPSYYPTGNSMSLMLPFSLEDDSHVDIVLVVELTPAGNYQGQTILTLQQAYVDARLLCRPNSEWLTTANLSNIKGDTEDET